MVIITIPGPIIADLPPGSTATTLEDGRVEYRFQGNNNSVPLNILAAQRCAELRTAAAEAQTALLGDHGAIMRRLAEYSELLTLTTAGAATEAERSRMVELIGERANSEAIDARLEAALAAVDAALAAGDRAALLAVEL